MPVIVNLGNHCYLHIMPEWQEAAVMGARTEVHPGSVTAIGKIVDGDFKNVKRQKWHLQAMKDVAEEIARLIDLPPNNAIVYCMMGEMRSATAAGAFLILYREKTADQALEILRQAYEDQARHAAVGQKVQVLSEAKVETWLKALEASLR